jgi:probable HAF family extracellular repeat protein
MNNNFLSFLLCTISGCALADKAVFRPVGDLPGTQCVSNDIRVSHNGRYVAGWIEVYLRDGKRVSELPHVFLIDLNGTKSLKLLPAKDFNSGVDEICGVSDCGTIVGRIRDKAFRWTHETGTVELGYLERKDGSSTAEAISPDGNVIVGQAENQPYKWTEKTGMVGLGCLPGAKSKWGLARAVSADGETIVGVSDSQLGHQAFIWTESEGMLGLGMLMQGKGGSEAFAVSADGNVVVGKTSSKSGTEAFRWSKAAGITGLGCLGVMYPDGFWRSLSSGVSADGNTIVGSSESKDAASEAFIWIPKKGMQNLKKLLVNDYNLPVDKWPDERGIHGALSFQINDFNQPLRKWTLDTVRLISDDGSVLVGEGTNPRGDQESWILSFSKKE